MLLVRRERCAAACFGYTCGRAPQGVGETASARKIQHVREIFGTEAMCNMDFSGVRHVLAVEVMLVPKLRNLRNGTSSKAAMCAPPIAREGEMFQLQLALHQVSPVVLLGVAVPD